MIYRVIGIMSGSSLDGLDIVPLQNWKKPVANGAMK